MLATVDPNLPLRGVAQDLYSLRYPTQETCPMMDHADDTTPTRKHELDDIDHTDQESIWPERSIDYDRNENR